MGVGCSAVIEVARRELAVRSDVREIGFRQDDLVALLRREVGDLGELTRERGVEDELICACPASNRGIAAADVYPARCAALAVERGVASEINVPIDFAVIDDRVLFAVSGVNITNNVSMIDEMESAGVAVDRIKLVARRFNDSGFRVGDVCDKPFSGVYIDSSSNC
jgi:hypothetical protein